jgi:AcrR family transcriptional regulator
VTGNRERALEAAVELLGTAGMRALTHARVDARAGLPPGSTSNHFRTRAALVKGVLDHMLAVETPVVDAMALARTPAELVTEIVRVYEFLTGPSRTMTTARMVLLLEASHDETLRAELAAGRASFERLVMPSLVALGAPDPQALMDALASAIEGMYLHRIARHADIDPEPVIRLVLRGGLGR